MTRLDVLSYISHGISQVGNPDEEFSNQPLQAPGQEGKQEPRKPGALESFTVNLIRKAADGLIDPHRA